MRFLLRVNSDLSALKLWKEHSVGGEEHRYSKTCTSQRGAVEREVFPQSECGARGVVNVSFLANAALCSCLKASKNRSKGTRTSSESLCCITEGWSASWNYPVKKAVKHIAVGHFNQIQRENQTATSWSLFLQQRAFFYEGLVYRSWKGHLCVYCEWREIHLRSYLTVVEFPVQLTNSLRLVLNQITNGSAWQWHMLVWNRVKASMLLTTMIANKTYPQ